MEDMIHVAIEAHQSGDFDRAAELYDRVLSTDPKNANALHLRGLIFAKKGDNFEAIRRIGEALKIQPNSSIFHSNMSWSLSSLDQLEIAKKHAERAIQIQPDLLNAHRNLATVLGKMGDLEQAASVWRHVMKNAPDDAKVKSSLGAILLEQGHIDDSITYLRDSIRINPDSIRPYIPLAEIGSIKLTQDEMTKLEELAHSETLPQSERADALFALATCRDRAGEYDQAFGYFAEGNRLKTSSFNSPKHEEYINDLIHVFDTPFFSSCQQGSDSQRPVFVVGMPRSGTTLTEQILASHPNIHGVGERDEMRDLKNSIANRISSSQRFPMAVKGLTEEHLKLFADEALSLDQDLPDSIHRVVNKLPGNFQSLGLISMLFPKARVIHCRRNALDTCLSCFFQNFVSLDYSFSLDHLADVYLRYRRLAEHWQRVLPLSVFNVDYEEMTASPESLIRRMVEFVELPWNDKCLSHQKNKTTVRTASKWQVRQPIHTRSVNRWRNYEQHIGGLIERIGHFVDDLR
jgi:tetratricopeptide (TPR) repeat protein